MPSRRANDQFVDAVKPALESLLSDLQRTTEVLRRAGKKSSADDESKWDTNTTSSVTSLRRSVNYGNAGDDAERSYRQSTGGQNNENRYSTLSGDSQSAAADYQTIPKGNCAACGSEIVGQVVIALGQMWHPEHYVCCHCGEEIGHRNFFERGGKAYCENDYHEMFSPRCAYCNGPIKDRCITALGKTYHYDHFTCHECGQPFGDEGFHEKDGNALCKSDFFRLHAPQCRGCSQPITTKYITALETHWHPECFVCQADEHFSKQCPMNVTYFEEDESYY